MARDAGSYQREKLLLAMVPELMKSHGLTHVSIAVRAGMKFAEAQAADGTRVGFWVKQAWKNETEFAAFQFGMVDAPAPREDQLYLNLVRNLVANAKARGAHYLLMAHMPDDVICSNYAVLDLDDVVLAYQRQLAGWPDRAKEGASPVLYFDGRRNSSDVERAEIVRSLSVPLAGIAGLVPLVKGASQDSKTVWAETERRMKQQVFRFRVGEACGWTCAVSGNQVKRVLEAAHLPGKNWRFDNGADDGIMLRVDLHRLLDAGLAELRNGLFWIHKDARCEQYAHLHEQPYERR
jgi:hypothetical protein